MSIAPPLRDFNGETVPHDHVEIAHGDCLIRRISEQQLVFDQRIGSRRVSSLAFSASSGSAGGLSVDIKKLIEEDGHDARTYVTTPRWIGSVQLTAGQLRDAGLRVGFDPLPDNPYHGQAWGSITKSAKDRILRTCQWFVQIPDVTLCVPQLPTATAGPLQSGTL